MRTFRGSVRGMTVTVMLVPSCDLLRMRGRGFIWNTKTGMTTDSSGYLIPGSPGDGSIDTYRKKKKKEREITVNIQFVIFLLMDLFYTLKH